MNKLEVFIVNDGSSDGTGPAIRSQFPSVNVIEGDGTLYWGGGMAKAHAAIDLDYFDYVWWLNDDVVLDPKVLDTLLETRRESNAGIVCAAFENPDTGVVTYSGMLAHRRLGMLRLFPVAPDPQHWTEVHSFNGNCVFIQSSVARKLGPVDYRLRHHFGDFDYGLRARGHNFRVVLMPGSAGYATRNSPSGTFRDAALSRRDRLRQLFSLRGYPVADKATYLRRHGGLFWFIQLASVHSYYVLRILARRPIA